MLRVEQSAGVVTLHLARPERGNALSSELVEALLEQVEAAATAAAQGEVHTLLLRADGRHFCTGLDLVDLDTMTDGDLLRRLVRIETLLAALWHAPLRTAVLAQGRTWGAGADLFVTCDLRAAQADTTLRFPGAQFGIVLGTRRLAERVGVDAARSLTSAGLEWSAAEALRAGLATDTALPPLETPKADAATVAALRAATRADHRDADLAALVRSAARPGLVERVRAHRVRMKAGS